MSLASAAADSVKEVCGTHAPGVYPRGGRDLVSYRRRLKATGRLTTERASLFHSQAAYT